jgi:hypothetical protein
MGDAATSSPDMPPALLASFALQDTSVARRIVKASCLGGEPSTNTRGVGPQEGAINEKNNGGIVWCLDQL